ncbi:MAG TPA: MarR family transcriptional regulator [Candidatus Nanoarchaeia archaeon]|nr:MarR family transcriptional regulator [Candidatus Nanoarchaeia archaeon]
MRKAEAGEKIRKDAAEKAEAVAKALTGDEKKAYELIMASQGAVFQGELVEKMGYSKMKVTRTLDKLEGQGLIERRRRGLANMVLIRYR